MQLNEEMKISIIDYEKQIPYGYIQMPLWGFVGHKKKSVLKNFSVNIYDKFTYEKKEEIELCLKSNEIKTIKDFNLEEQKDKFNFFIQKSIYSLLYDKINTHINLFYSFYCINYRENNFK